MVTAQEKKKQKEFLINVKAMYDHAESQGDFNSVNKEYRTSTFSGIFISIETFSGKYGDTFRYNFETDNKDKWFLLSSSKILNKVVLEIPLFSTVEVFKNDKGHWRIFPKTE